MDEQKTLTTRQSNIGPRTSLVIGGPIGIAAIAIGFFGALVLSVVLSGEGLAAMGLYGMFLTPTIFAAIGFLLSLWYAGRVVQSSFEKGQGLLWISTKYSFITNLFVWLTFMIASRIGASNSEIESLRQGDIFFNFWLPFVLFIFSTILSSFTVGLFISRLIRKRLLQT